MNAICVFVFPIFGGRHFDDAARFAESYRLYPAGTPHRLVMISNGGEPTGAMLALFDMLNYPYEVLVHDNSGWVIGAMQAAAKAYPCDMMVFFGTTAYLRGPNWLKRMVDAFERRGHSALYGSTGNCGDARVGVWPHIRTTGFWLSPAIMNMHPLRVTHPSHRYPFEHGENCLTQWCRNQGYKAFVCDWGQEYEWPAWDLIPGGFHRDQQQGVIVGDRLTRPPYYGCP